MKLGELKTNFRFNSGLDGGPTSETEKKSKKQKNFPVLSSLHENPLQSETQAKKISKLEGRCNPENFRNQVANSYGILSSSKDHLLSVSSYIPPRNDPNQANSLIGSTGSGIKSSGLENEEIEDDLSFFRLFVDFDFESIGKEAEIKDSDHLYRLKRKTLEKVEKLKNKTKQAASELKRLQEKDSRMKISSTKCEIYTPSDVSLEMSKSKPTTYESDYQNVRVRKGGTLFNEVIRFKTMQNIGKLGNATRETMDLLRKPVETNPISSFSSSFNPPNHIQNTLPNNLLYPAVMYFDAFPNQQISKEIAFFVNLNRQKTMVKISELRNTISKTRKTMDGLIEPVKVNSTSPSSSFFNPSSHIQESRPSNLLPASGNLGVKCDQRQLKKVDGVARRKTMQNIGKLGNTILETLENLGEQL